MAGSIGNSFAQPLPLIALIGDFKPVKLVFAWTQNDSIPLILGQMNFFMHFIQARRRYDKSRIPTISCCTFMCSAWFTSSD